jgi:hypothetical protein
MQIILFHQFYQKTICSTKGEQNFIPILLYAGSSFISGSFSVSGFRFAPQIPVQPPGMFLNRLAGAEMARMCLLALIISVGSNVLS